MNQKRWDKRKVYRTTYYDLGVRHGDEGDWDHLEMVDTLADAKIAAAEIFKRLPEATSVHAWPGIYVWKWMPRKWRTDEDGERYLDGGVWDSETESDPDKEIVTFPRVTTN